MTSAFTPHAASQASTADGVRTVRSVCPYCGVGCGMLLKTDGQRVLQVSGDPDHPANGGRLCTKGATSAQVLGDPGRLARAMARPSRDVAPVSLALDDVIATTGRRLRAIVDQHGPDAVALYVSGQMSMEAQYLANKLAKGFIGTRHIESNSRLCMASAGSGYKLSLGADAPPGAYDDIDNADLFLLIGANMADCHPILFLRVMDRVRQGAKLIVVDPRRTATAEKADLFLQLRPGTDLALLNGLLHLLVANGHIDGGFIAEFTEGWESMHALLEEYTPEHVASITGLREEDLHTAARWLGEAPEWMSGWTMGLNQSIHGTAHTNAICNLHLATGKLCRTGSGPFSLTGQPNAMGGREMGYMGAGLPGQRSLASPMDRAFIEALWELPPGTLPDTAGQGTVDMFQRMAAGEIKACWIICTNPVASVPNRQTVNDALRTAELVIAQDAFEDTETNRLADILLPAALWAEAEGVMVNSERNMTLTQAAVPPPGDARPDWWLIAAIARAMGYEQAFSYASAEEIFEEIRRASNPDTGYDLRGASYTRLRETPLQWPCAPGNSGHRNPIRYLNNGISQTLRHTADGHQPRLSFPTPSGRARFWARPWLPPAEQPDDDFPFVLNTGRVQHQWHTLTKTGRIAALNRLNPGPFVEIHPDDARQLCLTEGDHLAIRSRRGQATLPAVISDRVQPGQCFAPFHWNDLWGDQLTINAVTDDSIDAISQQPAMKYCAVALARVKIIATDSRDTTHAIEFPMALQSLRNTLGLAVAPPVQLNSTERQYLEGFIAGLDASGDLAVGVLPVLPESAPLAPERQHWINGLLAGMFSRVQAGTQPPAANDDRPRIAVLWASQTGQAEDHATQLAGQLGNAGWAVTLSEMDRVDVSQLRDLTYAVLLTSTFGDGDAPDNGQRFWRQLSSDDAPDLGHLRYALLALGDSHYAAFCSHGRRLDERLQALGATALLPRLECDAGNDSGVAPWCDALREQLPAVATGAHSSRTTTDEANTGYSRKRPYRARLVINQRLNPNSPDKATHLIGLDLGDSGLLYRAGDALGIYPRNHPKQVDALLTLLDLDGQKSMPGHSLSLRDALIEKYDICHPSRDALQWIARQNGNQALQTLLTPDHQTDLTAWLNGRQLLDVLAAFPVHGADSQALLAVLRPLQPRLYSIASGPRLHPTEVHLTVGMASYTSPLGATRNGLCSSFLCESETGTEVSVFVQTNKHFRLPEDGLHPVIMVGPGTGIAPFRGFLQERRERGDCGRNWLFFGERHQASDFYYREELLALRDEGHLTRLSLAFSRDQAEKVYVQDRMREEGAELWRWLEAGASFYVCGDASRMAKDVEDALLDVIRQHGGLDDAGARDYLQQLQDEKRYQRDVY